MRTLKPNFGQYLWALVLLTGIALFAAGSGAPASAASSASQAERSPGAGPRLVSTTGVTTTIYLPIVLSPPTPAISGLDVTQSVQTPGNSVPLVAGRRTMLRVYAYTLYSHLPAGDPLSDVRVSVAATRNGTALLGSPLVAGPQTAPITPSRADYGSTFNIELPSNWLSGAVVITATAYEGDTPYVTTTNWSSLTLNFNSVPALKVMVVPIRYTHTPTGQVYPAPSTDTLSNWIMRAFPISAINVTFHSTYAYSGDLSQLNDWNTLLSDIDALKSTTDHAPASQVYYGLIPTTDNSGHQWFYSGYSGLGYISYRVSIGLELPPSVGWGADQTGENAAHEIGHNLGRLHAPCGGPSGPDPNWPITYTNASIGQFGLDIPKGVLWNPATTYDLMSYCNPQWVSDYTYLGLYTDQRARGAAVLGASAPGLFIRGTFTSTGQVSLKPVYALSLPLTPLPATSDYQVELLNSAGQVVAAYPVQLLEATLDPGGTIQAISAVVPQPAQPVARVRLTRAGQTAAEKNLISTSVAPAAVLSVTRQAGAVTVRWSAAAEAALVRYSADGGQTWTTVGVDVLGGELTLASADLPAGGAGQFEVTLAEP